MLRMGPRDTSNCNCVKVVLNYVIHPFIKSMLLQKVEFDLQATQHEKEKKVGKFRRFFRRKEKKEKNPGSSKKSGKLIVYIKNNIHEAVPNLIV